MEGEWGALYQVDGDGLPGSLLSEWVGAGDLTSIVELVVYYDDDPYVWAGFV